MIGNGVAIKDGEQNIKRVVCFYLDGFKQKVVTCKTKGLKPESDGEVRCCSLIRMQLRDSRADWACLDGQLLSQKIL